MLDGLTDALVSLALTIINFFPQSPFRPLLDRFHDSDIYTILCYVNYILPISDMLAILSLWIVGVSAYYIYQLVLRWIRVID